MAKRRKLEAPSAEDLSKLEEEFRRETPAASPPPIAQVAQDAASALSFATPSHDAAEAQLYREAEEQGLLIREIPLDQINADSMVRDRSVIDTEALAELKSSIVSSGLRLPIEVYALPDGQGTRYGLLSGYRRLHVVRDLFTETELAKFGRIKAIVREPKADTDRFAAMVEENEIRQQLTQYERGRIAAIAAKQGVFANTEAAVAAMFPAASKAKRSKIRSFAMIFEELGDLLEFPENLRERDGLKIAQALRNGAEDRLREVLEAESPADAASEWALIEATLDTLDPAPRDPSRGGRPSVHVPQTGWTKRDTLTLSSGITLRKSNDMSGYTIHISGKNVTPTLMDRLFDEVRYLLEKP